MATSKTVAKNLTGKTNAEYWDLARKYSPDFASHTSEGTAVEFSEKGFEMITRAGLGTLNEFFEISMRVAFQLLNQSTAKNPLSASGLVQHYSTPNGGYVQRMSVSSVKPVSPAYKGLVDGGTVDPFVVRKPKIEERFFQQNFDFQNIITVQEYQIKTMFISEYGMGELLSGILTGMANGYTIQEYLNIKECLNAAINSDTTPLKETQKLTVSMSDTPTDEELVNMILSIKDTATRMNLASMTGMYNALGFESAVDTSDMVLLLRAGYKNAITTKLMVGAFNPEYLSLPFEVVEVDDFGGIEHYSDSGCTKAVYPVYDKLGAQIGWADTEGATTSQYTDAEIYKKDPNNEVIGVIGQKGMIFENEQNGYSVTPIYNPRGMYTNYIANKPNNGINYDPLYNMVTILKA